MHQYQHLFHTVKEFLIDNGFARKQTTEEEAPTVEREVVFFDSKLNHILQ